MRAWERVALALVVALALALRLREPLSSPIIGAEDPYFRMGDAWDVVLGRGFPEHYPPGFALLLAPFTLLGPDGFYAVARFGPPFLGAVETLGVFLLCRAFLRPTAALAGATAIAVMPENVLRTNLLFPTALDLALLPFLFLLVLRASEGRRAAWWGAGVMLGIMLVTHPWVVALVVPTLGLFALALLARHRHRASQRVVPLVAGVGAGGIALVLVLQNLPGTWNPTHAFFENAWPVALQLATDPASYELPIHVNLARMLTMPILVLAVAGVVAALAMRTPLALLVLAWCAFILPFALVDWFDVWFIPHRSVAYLSVGVAVLCALPFHYVAERARDAPRPLRAGGAVAALALVLALTLPSAFAVGPWYRLYDEDDHDAWRDVAARDPDRVITGSWQAAEGYRAVTGEDSAYNPSFFEDERLRDSMLAEQPRTIVLIDQYTRENGHPRGFLDSWRQLGEWDGGRVKAYEPR